MPGFGMLEHTGRTSGRTYRTPLNVAAVEGGFIIVLVYGRESDWLRNVEAAGGARLVHRGKPYALSNPRVDPRCARQRWVPLPMRLMARLVRSDGVLRVDAVPL